MPAAPRSCPTGGDHALPLRGGTPHRLLRWWQDPHPHDWGATGRWLGKVLGGGDSPCDRATRGGGDDSGRRLLTAVGGLRWPTMCSKVSCSSREKRGWGGTEEGGQRGLELTGRGDHDNFGFDSSGANSWSGPRVIGVWWECGVNYWKKKSCEGEGKGMMVALGPFKAVQWHGAVRGGWWHGAVRGGAHVTWRRRSRGARPIPGDGIRGQQWWTWSGVRQGRWGRLHVHPAATLMAAATYSIWIQNFTRVQIIPILFKIRPIQKGPYWASKILNKIFFWISRNVEQLPP
jgi:hypothetical protein